MNDSKTDNIYYYGDNGIKYGYFWFSFHVVWQVYGNEV